MNKKTLYMITIISLIYVNNTSTTSTQKGIIDFLLNAADSAYRSRYNEYVVGTHSLLNSIVNEVTPFSLLFSTFYAPRFSEMYYLLLSIRSEWPVCVARYEYVYGYSLTAMANVHSSFDKMWNAMRHAHPTTLLVYNYEIESILAYLENALYEMRRPVPYADSLEYIENCFGTIAYIINGM